MNTSNKINWFCRLSLSTALLLIAVTILIKVVIWSFALNESNSQTECAIYIKESAQYRKVKFTTEKRQKLFNKINYLLTPAFTIFFAGLAVKLVNTPNILEVEN